MKLKEIRNIDDLYSIVDIYDEFDEITVYTKDIKHYNVLSYVFKYSLWALKKNGLINVYDESSKLKKSSNSNIDFWQVKHIFFKYLNNYIEIKDLSNKNSYISAKKVLDYKENEGVSFCIVFSGNDDEIQYLDKSIDSIVQNNIDPRKYEIIVCGPAHFDYSIIFNKYLININYLPFDLETEYRVEITKKKNFLLKNAKFNIVSINHCRIVYNNNFFSMIMAKKFDVTTSRVYYYENNKYYPYLDLGLISTYNIGQISKYKALVSEFIDNNYLYYMKNRVPYIGGGLTIFNKNTIKSLCYDENIAWNEAEDIDISKMADSLGLLQDIKLDLKAYSLTKKYAMRNGILFKFKLYIAKFLIKKGLL